MKTSCTGSVQLCILTFVVSTLASTPAAARIWWVPDEVASIQAAVDSAAFSDTVLVACGTYFEHDIVMKGGITLRGETGAPDCVIIDAQGLGRVFECNNLVERVYFRGLTITGGYSVVGWFEALGGGVRCLNSGLDFRDCTFTGNTARIGGGIGYSGSFVTLTNCTFDANSADHQEWAGGGALWCRDSVGALQDCTFTDNTAYSLANPDDPGDGGAVFMNHSQVTVADCTFTGNTTGAGAGGLYSVDADQALIIRCHFEDNWAVYGAGVYLEQSYATLQECTFRANSAVMGGAMDIGRYSDAEIIDCDFIDNESIPWEGGAIACWRSTVLIRGCLFQGNMGAYHGGALALGESYPTVEECVFIANETPGRGGAISCLANVDLVVNSCTMVGNSAAAGSGLSVDELTTVTVQQTIIAFAPLGESVVETDENSLTLTCSNIYGNTGGDWVGSISDQLGVAGNIAVDPMFCDLGNNNLALYADSPCLPGNHPDGTGCGLIGALPAGCAITGLAERVGGVLGLEPNQPNPFNPRTVICYSLAEPTCVSLQVFDLAGRLVRRLVAEANQASGRYEVTWEGRDDAGRLVSAGVYFYQLVAGTESLTRRMVMVR